MEKQSLEVLEDFEEDSEWFHNNMDELRKKFLGKFVAIKNKEPIASDEDIEVVITQVLKQGENPSFVFIEFVYAKDFMLLL